MIERVLSDEMPPGDTKLTPKEKAVLKQWVQTGAKTLKPEPKKLASGIYITDDERNFWSFQLIQNRAVPKVKSKNRVRNPIDAFLLQKLEAKKMTFSPDATRQTLIRRAYLDLIGLPPTPKEVDQFVKSKDPKAYEKLVDRLLASSHYGERWGRHWLDVTGYADSEGYHQSDPVRKHAYRYRDYVIKSLNNDKPFDQFIREQLAGDEMVSYPYKNLSPQDAEKLVATGFLRMVPDGTVIGNMEQELARNQVMADTIQVVGTSLLGLTINCAQCHNHRHDPIPQTDYYQLRAVFEPAYDWKRWRRPNQRLVSLYTDADRAKAAKIEAKAKKVDAEYKVMVAKFIDQTLEDQLLLVPKKKRAAVRTAFRTAVKKRSPKQVTLLKKYPKVLKIHEGSLYLYDREILALAQELSTKFQLEKNKVIRAVAQEQVKKKFAYPKLTDNKLRKKIQQATLRPIKKRSQAQKVLLKKYLPNLVTYETLTQFNPKEAKRLKKMELAAEKQKGKEKANRMKAMKKKIADIRATKPKEGFIRALTEIPKKVPETRFFSRGNFNSPKQKVFPAVLSILPKMNQVSIAVNNTKIPTTGRRLAYAQHLTTGKHPLVTRVLVNRFWMHHFGKGIVNTPGDFGVFGDRPSHPELLDWLAMQFVKDKWSLKKFHRLVMTSTAYRQQLRQIPQNTVDPDPENRLLSGMSLRRIDAEVLRDSILQLSGLLNKKQFGEPVSVMHDAVGQVIIGVENTSAGRLLKTVDMKGEQYRRSVYVQMRRSKPLAMLDMFDAPVMTPNCELRSSSTVAPQALLLMNNDFVVKQSAQIAELIQKKAGTDRKKQIEFAWKWIFNQNATPSEIRNATAYLTKQTQELKNHRVAKAIAKRKKSQTIEMQAFASLCQTLISSNKFLYID